MLMQGRAGKTGFATTYLTEHDEAVFYDLKQYLTQTGSEVPAELARHHAANNKPGDVTQGKRRRDTVIYQ